MRRAIATIGLTIIGLWLVLAFKSSPLPRVNASANTTTPPTTAVSSPTDTSGQPPASGPPSSSDTTTTAATAPGNGSGQRTVNGDVISTQYGDVQVAIVFQGTRIVDVKALQLPFDRPRSQDISSQAAPLLHDEVIQAQSANIDTLGGATFTSEAYAESLQSALDRAHA